MQLNWPKPGPHTGFLCPRSRLLDRNNFGIAWHSVNLRSGLQFGRGQMHSCQVRRENLLLESGKSRPMANETNRPNAAVGTSVFQLNWKEGVGMLLAMTLNTAPRITLAMAAH